MHTFETHGIVEFDPIGEKYNANFHTALFMMSAKDKQEGTVFEVQKTGYMIKDRVLRSAAVGVVKDD
jgi:molecular chaperone GrpE